MGGKSDVPPAPDYRGAAAEDAAASQTLATQQNYANRPTQNTPWGSTFWTTGQQVDPATGQPVTNWTQNQTLDPALQGALNDQLGLQSGRSQLAGSFMGRVADEYQQPFDWTNLPGTAGTPQQQYTMGRNVAGPLSPTTQTTNEAGFSGERNRIEQGLFDRMRPEHERQQQQLQTQLANQGFTPGSEGYNQEMQRVSDQQARERFNAMEMGGQEQARMQQMLMGQQQQAFGQQQGAGQFFNAGQQQLFGQDLGANAQNWQQGLGASEYQNRLRQQAIAEQAMARGMSLNEMNALLTGQQVGSPQMPQFASATAGQAPQYLKAAGMQYDAGLDQYNAGQQGDQATMQGLFKMGAAIAPLFMSDVRLKTNIERCGTHACGIGIYEYDIEDRRERGVLAQELIAVYPRLVFIAPGGYLMVDYAGLEKAHG